MTTKTLPKSKPTRTKRTAEKLVNAEIRRAAARAGIHVHTIDREVERRANDAAHARLVTWIAPALVHACDQLGEEIATIADSGGTRSDANNVVDTLLLLWKLRWELGLTPKDVADSNDAHAAGGAP
jgi:hypothetical protein